METIMMKDQNVKNVSKKSLDESGTQKSNLRNICGLQDIPI
jgi:hypothetical protein